MIEEENLTATFKRPDIWDKLSLQEKEDLIIINNMIKLVCVADFSSYCFKEVSSLNTKIEEQLNKDPRLDINVPQEQCPDLKGVLKEIQRSRTKINQHHNQGEDSFQQKTKGDFFLLGFQQTKYHN